MTSGGTIDVDRSIRLEGIWVQMGMYSELNPQSLVTFTNGYWTCLTRTSFTNLETLGSSVLVAKHSTLQFPLCAIST